MHSKYGLEHGVNYADAYLKTIGKMANRPRPLKAWPYQQGSRVKLFILAGHRNMEGERAFVQELETPKGGGSLRDDIVNIAYKYSIGGGYKTSDGWEPLGPAGAYDNFGPELSFGRTLQNKISNNIAIAKFTHSGTQIIDWTPEGSVAESRNIYTRFIAFFKKAIEELEDKNQQVELAGIFYHLGENDMSFGPYRRNAAKYLQSIVRQSRQDVKRPGLNWYVSQQPPTDDKRVNSIDVTAEFEQVATADRHLIHIKAFDLPRQEKKLVITTAGIVQLGELIATSYIEHEQQGTNKD